MRAVLQRVIRASVTVGGETVGEIGAGLVVLLGVSHTDTERDAEYLAGKVTQLRIFNDESARMNRSLLDVGGELLIVSQFTLYGDTQKGRRPSWDEAAPADLARNLYDYFTKYTRSLGVTRVSTGVFQAHMMVELVNDGPVTLICESKL